MATPAVAGGYRLGNLDDPDLLFPMSVRQMMEYLGKDAEYPYGGFTFLMRIEDARYAEGQLEFKLAPTSGSGSDWVPSKHVKILPAT